MKTKNLIPMVQFIIERAKNAPLEPYHEVNEKFVNDVVDYATFLDSNLTDEMFIGDNPIFPGFIKCTPAEADKKDILNSFYNFGKDEYMIRMYRDYEANRVTKKTFVTSSHLKKVNDLITFGLQYIDYNS